MLSWTLTKCRWHNLITAKLFLSSIVVRSMSTLLLLVFRGRKGTPNPHEDKPQRCREVLKKNKIIEFGNIKVEVKVACRLQKRFFKPTHSIPSSSQYSYDQRERRVWKIRPTTHFALRPEDSRSEWLCAPVPITHYALSAVTADSSRSRAKTISCSSLRRTL